MAFTSLTPEQQSIVAEYTRQQRATVGEFARLLNHMAALGGADFVADLTGDLGTNGVTGIITSVGALETLMGQGHATNLYRAES